MKTFVLSVLLFAIPASIVYANCGNDDGNGNGCNGVAGPQGPAGPQGAAGTNGINGTNGAIGPQGSMGATGANGIAGKNGAQGVQGIQGAKGDAGDNMDGRLTLNIGADVRWHDWKHIAIASGYRYDIHHYGSTVDMFIVQIKLGKSYEEQRIDELQSLVASLQNKNRQEGK